MYQISSNDSGLLCVYDRAIVVSYQEDDSEVMSAVIMYNMALLSHSRGLQLSRFKCLLRATKLYRMAISILMRRESIRSSVSILFLALFNNLAHVYSYTYEVHKMNECLECMRQTLSAFDHTAEESEKYSVFFANSICAQGSEHCAASAA
jgi:hypothetical protein